MKIYLNKFAEGGRNAQLWNGFSTISSAENFIVFNFQSLLANNAGNVANAQMLLVMRWLNNEVINNKDYNARFHTKRKVIVVIDEAHVFIDPRKTVALEKVGSVALSVMLCVWKKRHRWQKMVVMIILQLLLPSVR